MRNREPLTSQVVPMTESRLGVAKMTAEATVLGSVAVPRDGAHSVRSAGVDLVPKAFQEFRNMLSMKNDELTRQAAKLQELTYKCRSQSDIIVDLQTAKENLLDEMDMRDAALEETTCNGNLMCDELAQSVTDVSVKLAHLEEAMDEAALRHHGALIKVEELADDLRRLHLRHEEFASEFVAKYTLELEAKKILKDELELHICDLRAKAEGLERDLKASCDLAAELESKSSAFSESLEQSEANVKRLEERFADKCNEILEIQETRREIEDRLNRTNDEMRLEFESKIESKDVELREENDKHRLELEAVGRQLEEHVHRYDILLRERAVLEIRVDELNDQLADRKVVYNKLWVELEQSEALMRDRSKEMESKSEEMAALKAELERAIVTAERKTEECEAVQKKVEAAEKQIVEQDDAAKTMADGLVACKNDAIRLEAEIAEARRTLETTKEQMTRGFAATIEKYKLDGERYADKIDGELNDARSQIASLTALSKEKDARLDKIVEEKSAVARDLHRIESVNVGLRSRLDEAFAENATLVKDVKQEKDANERRLKEMSVENDRLKKDLNETSEVGRRQSEAAKAENDRLKKDLKEKSAALRIYAASFARLKKTSEGQSWVRTQQASAVSASDHDAAAAVAGILKRKAAEPTIDNGRPSKHVAFETSVNSETSESDCLEMELIEPEASKCHKVAAPKPSFVLRPSTPKSDHQQPQRQQQVQQRQRTQCYVPKQTDITDGVQTTVGRLKPPPRGTTEASSKKSVGGEKKRTLAKRDARLDWVDDDAAASEYLLLGDD